MGDPFRGKSVEMRQTSGHGFWQKFCNLKQVTLLLTFPKEIIFFFFKKISSSFFLCSLELR